MKYQTSPTFPKISPNDSEWHTAAQDFSEVEFLHVATNISNGWQNGGRVVHHFTLALV